MTLTWEAILHDLEESTAQLATLGDDIPAIERALEKRQMAVERAAQLAAIPSTIDEKRWTEILRRLEKVLSTGAEAVGGLNLIRQKTFDEWRRWNHIHAALGGATPPKPGKVDYVG